MSIDIKKVKIGDFVLPIDYKLTKEQLNVKYPFDEEDANLDTLGVYDPDEQKIYIASDIGQPRKLRTLLHECTEAMVELGELGLEDNHTKIVALENFLLSLIVNNKSLIRKIWKEFNGSTDNQVSQSPE